MYAKGSNVGVLPLLDNMFIPLLHSRAGCSCDVVCARNKNKRNEMKAVDTMHIRESTKQMKNLHIIVHIISQTHRVFFIVNHGLHGIE